MDMFAHSVEGKPESMWEPLEIHLAKVANLAAGFCESFSSGDWGRLAGLWHDLGKYHPDFQRRIRGEEVQVEHAGLGAALSVMKGRLAGRPLAFAIAGHHAGLANDGAQGQSDRTPLVDRLKANRELLEATMAGTVPVPTELLNAALPAPPPFLAGRGERDASMRRVELWTRFIFSALVDADRRATAKFYAQFDPTIRLHEELRYESLSILRNRLDAAINRKALEAKATHVNVARAEVLAACRKAAARPPGRFSLTVPTGGGKTLAGMSFALNHALLHGLRRVIVVIPFTSIIEQNAKVYRAVLGEGNVVEHHSNLDQQRLAEENTEREVKRKLAAENWDAPVVVTTTVQFFESLFSDHPSRCRKLHNIAKSVIILDEVQTLPAEFLLPILDGLAELSDPKAYGCSVVLSTATPPALRYREGQGYGLHDVDEIVDGPHALARRLKRVSVYWPDNFNEVLTYDALAAQIASRHKALAVVHRRQDARDLAERLQRLMPSSNRRPSHVLLHLSALMCPAHRLRALRRARAAVRTKRRVYLISTQLIEAGVDIDFPVVYRALAGLDSLAQAAGRCNREGRLIDPDGNLVKGEFVVFRAETDPPTPSLKAAMKSTGIMLGLHGRDLDPSDPDRCLEFFNLLYFNADKDARGIQTARASLNFATVAADFKLIDEYAMPIIVPYGHADERLAAYRANPTRLTRRALQPFIVQIPPWHHSILHGLGALSPIDDTLDELTVPFHHLYDSEMFGLKLGESPADPGALIP